jgi:hypothetical protein
VGVGPDEPDGGALRNRNFADIEVLLEAIELQKVG